MKTTISIPDAVFEDAERLVESLGLTRSRLYAQAVEQFVQKNSETAITEQLNAVYKAVDSSLPAAWAHAQQTALDAEEW